LKKQKFHEEFVFDFDQLSYIDPFSLLYLSSEIQRFCEKYNSSKCSITNYEKCTYPAHMGFFKACGFEFGKMPGEALGSSKYIPITIYNTKELRFEASQLLMHPSAFMEKKAREISKLLLQSSHNKEVDVLTFCIREIFRNVIEHSNSEQFGFCAQFRERHDVISFSIIDRGIGLKKSLSENPTLRLDNDLEAIYSALNPGISGKVYRGQKYRPKGDWVNSGYGLYMTSNICRKGGGFFIASGNTGLYLSESKKRQLEIPIEGTAVNLAIRISQLDELKKMLAEIDEKNESLSPPSISSMGLLGV
jgi:hypothetical protein